MEFTLDHKKKVEDEIVTTMLNAVSTNQLKEEDLPIISNVVILHIEEVFDQKSLEVFLQDLASRWSIFKSLLVLELRDMKERIEKEVAEGVLLLARHGKIENAIQLAKSATNSTV